MSEIWPGHNNDKWEGENEYGCATPQLYYLLLLVVIGVISFVVGYCTAFLIIG